MRVPTFQWQGAQGYEWWKLDIVRDKFIENEDGHELIIKISDKFTIRAFTIEKAFERWYENEQDFYWSEIHINNVFYKKSCEHIDEDLYWLFDNLPNHVFIQYTKKTESKLCG